MLSFYNFQIFSIIITIFLIIITYYHLREYSLNKDVKNIKFPLYILRLTAILLIVFFYLHPVYKEYFKNPIGSEFNIYIDVSKSMKNNVLPEKLNELFSNMENWFNENNIKSYYFGVGREVEPIKKPYNLIFSEDYTNLDDFRKKIINSNKSNFILITDGLRPYGEKQKYNFNKKVNIIGVGENSYKNIYFKNASIRYQDKKAYIDFAISKIPSSDKKIDLYKNGSKVCSISDLLSTGLSDVNKVNISSLNLDSFNNLKLVMLDTKNNFIDEINVKYNLFNQSESSIYFTSGKISNNTKYFLELFDDLGFDSIYFEQNINNYKKNFFLEDINSKNMIFFDNYFHFEKDIKVFESIFKKIDKNSTPMFISFGDFNNYDLLKELSELLSFKIYNEETERKIESSILYDKYDIKNGYYFEDIADYRIECSDNKSNIRFEDGSFFLCRNENVYLLFYPEIGRVSYKSIEFGNKIKFDNMIMDIISNAFYGDDRVYIYSKKNSYYTNEPIEIDLISNSNEYIYDSDLYRFFEAKKNKIPKDKSFTIPYSGRHKIKLLDNYGNELSNTLDLLIEDFNAEESIKGQNHRLLLNIANASNGIYSNLNQINLEEFLTNIKDYQNKKGGVFLHSEVNFRNHLHYLILGIIMLAIEWFLRKRYGLV